MPIYEYLCPKCKKEVEVLQKFSDPNPTCDCNKKKPITMKKQMSRSGGFILKGQCWERDGYSSSQGKNKK